LPFLEALPAGALVVAHDGRIVAASGRAERMFGYGPGELDGRTVESLMPEGLRGAHAHERQRFVSAGLSRQMASSRDLSALCKDGRLVPVQVGLSQIEVEEGHFVLAVVVDLTERQILEARASVSQLGVRLHPDDRARLEGATAGAAASLGALHERFRVFTSGERTLTLEVDATPRRETDGTLIFDGRVRVLPG